MEENNNEPTSEQWVATIGQLQLRFGSVVGNTASLDEKGDRLLQISGVIVALMGLLGLGSKALDWPESLLLIIATGLFLFVLYLTQLAALPQDYPLPGPTTETKMVDRYLSTDTNATYGQIALNLLSVSNGTKEKNDAKAAKLKKAAFAFALEVTAFTFAVLFNLT